LESRRVGRVFGDQGPGGVEADPRVQAADVHERGDGDQLVAQLLLAVPLEEGEQPIGEIGGPGRVGGHEEFDDLQLGIGHGRSPFGTERKPVAGLGRGVRTHPSYPSVPFASSLFGGENLWDGRRRAHSSLRPVMRMWIRRAATSASSSFRTK
jgi:hypothetical protein